MSTANALPPMADVLAALAAGQRVVVIEDETTEDLARNMKALQVRRLPVVTRDKRLVGIVSLADLACTAGADEETKEAIAGVSERYA